MEQALREAREIGYIGVERGQRMPGDTEGLRAYLDGNNIALCGGWCSGASLVNDFATEREAVREQVELFVALNSPCIVYAECSNTSAGADRAQPVNDRPKADQRRGDGLRVQRSLSWPNGWADQGMTDGLSPSHGHDHRKRR